jgi:DNA polymerase elongation subunit (family B)
MTAKPSETLPKSKNRAQIEQTMINHLHDLGFKLVALASNGLPVAKWSYAYEHPEDIIPEKLTGNNAPIRGIATIFGRTRLTDPNGRPYYLCGFDCDSESIAGIFSAPVVRQSAACIELAKICSESAMMIPDQDISDILTKLSLGSNLELTLLDILKRITYVTKSRKSLGFHFYWLEQELYPAIHLRDCKKDSEFEIKTDKSSSALTLPPSTHRDDAKFRYSAIGHTERIASLPGLYRLLTENILASYLIDDKKKGRRRRTDNLMQGDRNATDSITKKPTSEDAQNADSAHLIPTATTIINDNLPGRFQILNSDKEEKIVSLLLSSYKKGFRNEICFALSGALFVCGVSHPNANNIVTSLCDHTNDPEKESRLNVVHNTYKNGIAGRPIAGIGALIEALAHIIGDASAAYEIVSMVVKTINVLERNAENLVLTATNRKTESTTTAPSNTSSKPADDALSKYHKLILRTPSIRNNSIDFILSSILKEAREEQLLGKQLLITMLSAYTKNPLNMCINAPSGEGKNYVISRVSEYFPSDDVIVYAGMTDKALFHRRGELVIKSPETKQYEPLMPKLAVIKQALAEREKQLSELTQENTAKGVNYKVKNEISYKSAKTPVNVNLGANDNDSPITKQTYVVKSSSSRSGEEKEGEIQSLRKEILQLMNVRTELFKQAKKLINLENKILIFLDTPNSSLLSALMPLLSHDKYEVEYEFVDTSDGIETRTNVLQGWPAVIFAQALDITRDKRYPEIQRRFITTNPKMVPKKYKEAINLIGSKFGLPDLAYQVEVISDKEKNMVKVVVEALKHSILDFTKNQEPGKNNVLMPYHNAVSGSLPDQKAFDMTLAYRLFTYLSLLSLIHKDRRPKLIATPVADSVREECGNNNSDGHKLDDDETTKDLQLPATQVVPFAIFEDLQEAISLMEYGDGTKPYVLEWYREVFLPTHNAKKNPDFKVDVKKNQKIEESRIAVTTEQLKEPTKKYTGRDLSTQQLLERYIYPLLNIGYIDSKDSEINGKAKIYWPILSSENISLFEKGESNNDLSGLKLHLGKNAQFPDKRYLISAIWRIVGYYSDRGYSVKIVDADYQHVITIEELVERYYSNPMGYFHRVNTDYSNENSSDSKESSDRGYLAGVHSAKGRVSASSTVTVVTPQNHNSEEHETKAQYHQESHSITLSEQEFAKSDTKVSTKTFVAEKTNVRICALDLEWLQQPDNTNKIFAAGFVDNNGWNEALHIIDYNNSEPALVQAIVDRVSQLPSLSVGWFTTGQASDLMILHERCIANGIESPVDISSGIFPRLKVKNHIDLYRIFEKELVRSSIFENKYRSLKLEDVTQALLGKGKYRGITGANIAEESVSIQKQYVLQDAQLAMELAQVNNGQVLDLMRAISELIHMDFEQVCHTGLSNWWAHVFDSMRCERSPFEMQLTDGSRYEGGLVLEPKTGNYENVIVVDVASLYPTVAILHNISFDTINCDCCKDRQDARVMLNDYSIDSKGYWICKQKEGAFPSKLRGYREERLRQKKLDNKTKDRGLKILINGGYGVFGYPGFKYFDKRVAELITAYGRHILRKMQELAREYGFDIIAGDTDSLFISGASNASLQQFLNKSQQELAIEVEHQRTFSKFLNIKKKHYIGIDSATEEPIVKGMEGKKSDRPRWVTQIFDRFVQDFKDGKDPTINIRRAINDLESRRVNPEDLKIFVTLSKDPTEYVNNTVQKRVGLHSGARKGDTIYYYKTDDANGNKKEDIIPINAENISIVEYKKLLLATLKDALEVMGFVSEEDGIALDIFYNIGGNKKQKGLKDMPIFGRQHESAGEAGKTT